MVKIESRYPTQRARMIADAVVDGMGLEEPMLNYIIAWEEAYFNAGGVFRP